MVTFLSPRKLKRLLFFKRRRPAGFTLIELLVAMIIGSLIVVALLTLVVQLTETNQKDAARSQVQQDMQAATDFIAQELREAVFVYNGECLQGNGIPNLANLPNTCPGIINHIPDTMTKGGKTPVLAFWRTKKLPQAIWDRCKDAAPLLNNSVTAATNPLVLKGVPCLAGYTYSLVVYAIDTEVSATWSGNARLIRYELSQFIDNATTEKDQTMGYVNPLQDSTYTFQQWPYAFDKKSNLINRQQVKVSQDAPGAQNPGAPTGNSAVLVDFLDDKVANGTTVPTPNCVEFGADAASQAKALTPSAAASPRGFYACVRDGGIKPAASTATKKAGQNQDVLLVMKGNVSGQSGFDKKFDNSERISPLQTRVLIRGVVDKP